MEKKSVFLPNNIKLKYIILYIYEKLHYNMGKYRIYPNKENTIQSGLIYENLNASQENVFSLVYGGGGTDTALAKRNSISRHLAYFDLADLQVKYSDLTINSAYTVSYVLKYKNAIPSDKMLEPEFVYDVLNKNIAAGFDLIFFPINKDWNEGRGGSLDDQKAITFKNTSSILSGYSNWLSATTFVGWDNPGVFTNPSAQTTNYVTQNFPIGSEDISVDISSMVNGWLSGGSTNYGIGIAYTRPFELISGDTRYISSFYSHKTNYAFKPYIEVTYNQVIRDDRHWVTNNRISRLFLYLFSGNQATNYYSAGTVTIRNSSNTMVYSGLTPTHHSKGVYYVDINMSAATKGQKYKDIWEGVTFVPGRDSTDFTNYFDIRDNYYNNNSKRVNDYAVDIYGVPNNAPLVSGEIYRVYADVRMSFSNQKPFTDFGLEYRISMGLDELVPWTAMNNAIVDDCLSCFFDLDTSWLLDLQTYKIEFRISEFGTKRLISDTLRFKVINPITI